MAQEVARALYVEAGQAPDAATRERLAKWGIATESAGRQRALLDLAWSQAGVAVAPSVFDADPLLLNCENGTIDLRTGELRPHDRDDLITRLAPVTFDPQARDPIFEGYLHDTTDGKADFAAYLQRAAGYTLTGLTDAECVFLVLGPGATGKSTLIEALLATLGDYGRKASFDTFLERGKGQVGAPRPDIASLRGARLVCAVETSGNRELAETVVKELSGGDTVTARYLFKPEFSYRPAFKLWLACNEAPKMTDTDTGLWRRLKRLPFEHVIASDAQDPAIKRHLTTDGRPAVLAWAVAGALAWQQSGLAEPTLVKDATAELRAEFDPLAEFLTARCTVRRGATELAGALRSAYESWAAEMGAKPIDNKEWGKRLRALGATTRRERLPEGQRSVWHGLELTPEGGGNDDSVHDVHNKPVFSKGSLVYTDLEIDLKNGVSTARCAQENADISAFDQRILDALAELGPQGGGYSTVAMKAHAQGPATRAALLRLAEAGLVVRAPGECYSLWPPRG
jgi:putative DNA primase/helicase